MFVIALTGGIGSGKTTVSKIFKSKDIPIIDTDIISRQIVEADKPAYTKILKIFGEGILASNKEIDRSKLRQLIFSSAQKKRQLENILHPLIWNEVLTQLENITSSPYCIVVVPLLFEKASVEKKVSFDRIAVVDVTEEMQIKRVKERDHCDESIIKNIIQSQVTRQTRLDAADDIIINTGDLKQLEQEIHKLHQQYLMLAK